MARKHPVTLRDIVQGYADGLRQEAIASRHDCNQSTISMRLSEAGISQKALVRMLRDKLSVDQIMATLNEPQLPLSLSDEIARLTRENEALKAKLVEMTQVVGEASALLRRYTA